MHIMHPLLSGLYALNAALNVSVLAFESSEQRRLQDELDAYNAALQDEMEQEKQRHLRNLEALNQRKEDMVKEKKQKLKVSNAMQTSHIALKALFITIFLLLM